MEQKALPRNSRILARAAILETLAARLNKLGPITTGEVWLLCRNKTGLQYGVIVEHFKAIMLEKQQNKEADFVKNGCWFIYRKKS